MASTGLCIHADKDCRTWRDSLLSSRCEERVLNAGVRQGNERGLFTLSFLKGAHVRPETITVKNSGGAFLRLRWRAIGAVAAIFFFHVRCNLRFPSSHFYKKKQGELRITPSMSLSPSPDPLEYLLRHMEYLWLAHLYREGPKTLRCTLPRICELHVCPRWYQLRR